MGDFLKEIWNNDLGLVQPLQEYDYNDELNNFGSGGIGPDLDWIWNLFRPYPKRP